MEGLKFTREDCVQLLVNKRRVLEESGEARYPKRSDFSDAEVVAIKAFLGPWPRALEAAGIKPVDIARAEARSEKRIAAKRRRTAEKKRRLSDGSSCDGKQ